MLTYKMLPLNILRNVSLDMLMARPATPYEKLISSLDSTRSAMELTSMYFQAKVCKTLERIEGGKQFTVNKFNREDGGGEVACVLQGGNFTISCTFALYMFCMKHVNIIRFSFWFFIVFVYI